MTFDVFVEFVFSQAATTHIDSLQKQVRGQLRNELFDGHKVDRVGAEVKLELKQDGELGNDLQLMLKCYLCQLAHALLGDRVVLEDQVDVLESGPFGGSDDLVERNKRLVGEFIVGHVEVQFGECLGEVLKGLEDWRKTLRVCRGKLPLSFNSLYLSE
jgi:hypothetical protein